MSLDVGRWRAPRRVRGRCVRRGLGTRPECAKPCDFSVFRRDEAPAAGSRGRPARAGRARQRARGGAARRPASASARPAGRPPMPFHGTVKAAQAPAGACQPVEEGVQLGVVGVVVLRVDLPDEGRAGPERAHQRIFAAHEVEVAGPEQVVEVGLRQRRQRTRSASAPRAAPGRGGRRAARRRPAVTSSSVGWPRVELRRAARRAPAARSRTG